MHVPQIRASWKKSPRGPHAEVRRRKPLTFKLGFVLQERRVLCFDVEAHQGTWGRTGRLTINLLPQSKRPADRKRGPALRVVAYDPTKPPEKPARPDQPLDSIVVSRPRHTPDERSRVYLWTDGSQQRYGLFAGWGWSVVDHNGTELLHGAGTVEHASTNYVELLAVTHGLRSCRQARYQVITIRTDSQYVYGTLRKIAEQRTNGDDEVRRGELAQLCHGAHITVELVARNANHRAHTLAHDAMRGLALADRLVSTQHMSQIIDQLCRLIRRTHGVKARVLTQLRGGEIDDLRRVLGEIDQYEHDLHEALGFVRAIAQDYLELADEPGSPEKAGFAQP